MTRTIPAFLLVSAALAGCAQTFAQPRLEAALTEQGLSERDASCMAQRMVDRLTIAQLKRLEELKPREGETARPATIGEFVDRIARVRDAEVVAVTASSAALCLSGLARVDGSRSLS